MESTPQRRSRSVYIMIGPKGAANLGIVKANDLGAIPIDADIRRIDEVEALKVGGDSTVGYLINAREHFNPSANYISSTEAFSELLQE
jgi:hypothetical protein